ncbi:TPA: tyrosine-type recombinase/integrase [Bacillus cereus]|nr:tyrosine-type recombinase/integrase [Bacillus cereus]
MKNIKQPIIEKLSFHERLKLEISTYTEKSFNEDGSIAANKVQNPYFLVNNQWDICFIGTIENFKEQYKNGLKKIPKSINFNIKNERVRLELKFVFYKKLFQDEWALSTLFITQAQFQKTFANFINEKYPFLSSLLDIDFESINSSWKRWLASRNVPTKKHISSGPKSKAYLCNTGLVNFLKIIYQYLYNFYDYRTEWDKDIWDVKVLNQQFSIQYNESGGQSKINFTLISNFHMRKELKKYFKQRLLGGHFSWATASSYMSFLHKFLNFIFSVEPRWNALCELERKHIELYLEWLNQYRSEKVSKKSSPAKYINQSLRTIHRFLSDLQLFDYKIAPSKSINLLIFPSDKHSEEKQPFDQVNYIPDVVLEQLFKNINKLQPEIQPVVWIAFKTGLRISDILGLIQDCLVKINGKYQLVTDIEKTYIKGHSIPIDNDLANIIAALIDKSILNSNKENNPNNYIFVRYRGSRKGRPYSQKWVKEKLNAYTIDQNITDENGNLFYFSPHQFRHTYAVKMLNGGADIFTVQELLAHASPEMTLRYARLLDNTKRKAFEEAVKQGVFSFDVNGEVYDVTDSGNVPQGILETLWRDHKLTAIDNPYGSCRARINGNCPYAEEPPCLTCNGGNPCKDLAIGLSEMDIAKYEIHIQSTSKMIEVAKQYGREEIAEKNEKNFNRLQDIYQTLKQGNIIFGRLDRIKRKQGVSNS